MLLFVVAPPPDDLGDQFGERAELEGELQIPLGLPGDDLEGRLHPVEIGAEDRAQNDIQRQLAHLLGDVHELAACRLGFPSGDETVVGRIDEGRKLCNDPAVEEGLHHVALPLPEIALAGHDALTQQDFDSVEPYALRVVAMV